MVSLVLCSVPDQQQALREIGRVLRPGGQLRFLEHVRAHHRRLARLQAALDATVWPAFGGGCHTGRDTATAITDAGFTIENIDRFRFPPTQIPFPSSPHIAGVATYHPGN